MRASTDSVTIEYEGYEDLFTWTFQELLEDFYKGDLSLVPWILLCTTSVHNMYIHSPYM